MSAENGESSATGDASSPLFEVVRYYAPDSPQIFEVVVDEATICTIYQSEVDADDMQTLVKLHCSHQFHLDCIRSFFNSKGSMQCPNCRRVEVGWWRSFIGVNTSDRVAPPVVEVVENATVICTICPQVIGANTTRTLVMLRSSHQFHLDCIGSLFNFKGIMECPNCLLHEHGVWRCFVDSSGRAQRSVWDILDEPSQSQPEPCSVVTAGRISISPAILAGGAEPCSGMHSSIHLHRPPWQLLNKLAQLWQGEQNLQVEGPAEQSGQSPLPLPRKSGSFLNLGRGLLLH